MLIRNNRFLLIVSGILAVAGISLAVYAHGEHLLPFDLYVSHLLQSFINSTLTDVMAGISYLFATWRAGLLVLFTATLFWWRFGWLEGIMIALAGLASLLNTLIKVLVGRPRPTAEQVQILAIETNLGFPSSHAFFSTLFLGMLAYLLFTHLKQKRWRILSVILLSLLVLLVGTSRVYLGVHWTSDVLGGYIIGGFFLTILILVYKWASTRWSGLSGKRF